jgi:hypothetical protein
MNALAPLLAALLSQAEPAPAAAEAPAADPAPAAAPAPAPAGAPAQGGVRPGTMNSKSVSPQEVTRQLERIKKMSPEESAEAARKLADEFGAMAGVKREVETPETNVLNTEGFAALPEVEQVKIMARIFSAHIVSGDARNLVLLSSFPFQLEDRNLATPEELHTEWLKNLRNKRTDVLTLYGVDVLTPQEMEKKYGRPPPRLARLPLNQPRTFISVNNLSGHAAIVVWRLINSEWHTELGARSNTSRVRGAVLRAPC